MVSIACSFIGVVIYLILFYQLGKFPRRHSTGSGRAAVVVSLLISFASILGVLKTMASHDVVDDLRYIWMYFAMGALWLGMFSRMFFVGVSLRDDLLERENDGAGYAFAGFFIGTAACFAGGNIGDGPGWWVVVFAAGLSTLTLSLLWGFLNSLTKVADHITIDRDPAIGLRMGGYFIAVGLILGRSVAGDWINAPQTVVDFARNAWPALIITVAAVFIERSAKPEFESERISPVIRGVLPALCYIITGILGLIVLGPIEGAP